MAKNKFHIGNCPKDSVTAIEIDRYDGMDIYRREQQRRAKGGITPGKLHQGKLHRGINHNINCL